MALHEHLPLLPADIYGWTKMAGEELCKLYEQTHGIPSIALRYGMFVSGPFFHYGIRLLFGGVDTHDVARSVMASIEVLTNGRIVRDAFNASQLCRSPRRTAQLTRIEPLAMLDNYYPGTSDLLRERGRELDTNTRVVPDAAFRGGARLPTRL